MDATERRSAAVITPPYPVGVAPGATPGVAWRQQAGWGYSGIPTSATTVELSPPVVSATIVAPAVTAGVEVALPPLSVSATVIAPTVAVGSSVVLSPLTASATLVAPMVVAGAASDVNIELPALSVSATLTPPIVEALMPVTIADAGLILRPTLQGVALGIPRRGVRVSPGKRGV